MCYIDYDLTPCMDTIIQLYFLQGGKYIKNCNTSNELAGTFVGEIIYNLSLRCKYYTKVQMIQHHLQHLVFGKQQMNYSLMFPEISQFLKFSQTIGKLLQDVEVCEHTTHIIMAITIQYICCRK